MVSKRRKILTTLLYPACFIWFIYTLVAFWDDVQYWKDPTADVHGAFIFFAVFMLLVKNIPMLLALFYCHRTHR